MSFFEQMANRPDLDPQGAEVKLDLCGMDRQDALHTLDHTVKHCKRMSTQTLFVSFDPAKPGAGETLFQPVARYFKFEKLNGYVLHAQPVLTKKTAGIFVTFKL
ncbi:MAG: hypothetical protein GC185_03960 [Alphaproteobacteria bacterium]|nr:hypothetical protein [Alphaproteobacteria bacterium]